MRFRLENHVWVLIRKQVLHLFLWTTVILYKFYVQSILPSNHFISHPYPTHVFFLA